MMGFQAILWSLNCVVFVASLTKTGSGCVFPTAVQSNVTTRTPPLVRDWRSRVKGQNTEFTLKVSVEGGVIKTVSTDNTAKSHTRVCLQTVGRNKFLVAHEEVGQMTQKYTCMQFIQRSDSVFQIKEAELSSSMGRDLCQNSNLKLNEWLVIDQVHVHEGRQICPLEGGFSIRIFDKSQRQGVCDGYEGETRLESECARGEGLHFYFRRQKCVPTELLMYSHQETLCLADWREGAYTFVLLRHNDEAFKQYMWLFRYPTSQRESFVAILFMDLVADMVAQVKSTNNYLRLDVVRDVPRPAHALCLDDYELCSFYSDPCSTSEMSLTCPRTCGICNATRPSVCNFQSRLQAQWYNAANPGNLALTINSTQLTTYNGESKETFKCIEWDQEEPSQDSYINHKMLVKEFPNGCRPRFSCVEFMQQTSSVLFTKISEELMWPFTKKPQEPLDCRHFAFEDDQSLTPNTYKSKYLNLVYLRASNSVPCDMPGDITNFSLTLGGSVTQCLVSLVTDEDGKSFILELTNCPEANIETSYTCVDSSRMLPKRDQLVVTRAETNADLIHCWVFLKKQSDVFYLLSAKDCNESVRRKLNKDRLRFDAIFSRTPKVPGTSDKTPTIGEATIEATPPKQGRSRPTGLRPDPTTTKISKDNDFGDYFDYEVNVNSSTPYNKTGVAGGDSDFDVTATSVAVVSVVFVFAMIQTVCVCKT